MVGFFREESGKAAWSQGAWKMCRWSPERGCEERDGIQKEQHAQRPRYAQLSCIIWKPHQGQSARSGACSVVTQ